MKLRCALILANVFLIFFLSLNLSAQYYTVGQDPATVTWRQITTRDYKIIYPAAFESRLTDVINSLDSVTVFGARTLNVKPRQIPIIVHNLNSEPNGITAWAPKRIELFTTPPQDLYPQDWIDQLLVHEYRHVAQFDRTRQGFTKVLSWFMGEQASAMVNGLFIPSWFLEGDAVCTETALSRSGRGRMPDFEMLLRTQILSTGEYSYDKAALGSFKTYIPNEYVLGYFMVANVRRKYGYQAWVDALDEVAKRPFLFSPFNRGLKKATTNTKELLYATSMRELDSMWRWQENSTVETPFTRIDKTNSSEYESLLHPISLNDTIIIALRTGIDKVSEFIAVNSSGESTAIFTPGFMSSARFSAFSENNTSQDSLVKPGLSGFKLVWTESISDPRWGQRNYSEIIVYDSNTKKAKRIAKHKSYYSPCFSPDGKLLAAVKINQTGNSSIIIMDAETGVEKEVLLSSDKDFFMTPAWSEDGNKLVFSSFNEKGKGIKIYDFLFKTVTEITMPGFSDVSNPVFAQNFIFFNGSFSGIPNIYAVQLSDKQIFQVTSAQYGAENARLTADGKRIVFSNYSAKGFFLAEVNFDPSKWVPFVSVTDFSPKLYKYLVSEEQNLPPSPITRNVGVKPEDYNKAAHLFKFHSWAPAYINYLNGENTLGISVMSQNDLSTAVTVLGYSHDIIDKSDKVSADFSYMGWYPVIDLGASYGKRTDFDNSESNSRFTYNETVFKIGVSLPLLFTGGVYYKGINIAFNTSAQLKNNFTAADNSNSGFYNSLNYSIYLYRFHKQSSKDLYPKSGQAISFVYRHSPWGDFNMGSVAGLIFRLYFPGLSNHHGIRFDFNIQKKVTGDYVFSNQVNLPRGYNSYNVKDLEGISFNYKFPLLYPDFSVGPLIYLKRVKTNLFFDAALAETHAGNNSFTSFGTEITTDVHFLRFRFPVDLGLRLGYVPNESRVFSNLLFSVNLSD